MVKALPKHIILIGFTHVGKSAIGKNLAVKLDSLFIDLDRQIEYLFETQYKKKYSVRQIMHEQGENFFRRLETQALRRIIDSEPSIISLGGGTPINVENQRLVQSNILIYVTVPRDVVFERMTADGWPAFLISKENPLEAFNELWEKRRKIYEKLADIVINNNSEINVAVDAILQKLDFNEHKMVRKKR